MRRISLLLIFQFTGIVWGQLATGSASANGVGFSYETRLEPPTPPIAKFGGGILTDKKVIKRHLCDFERKTYFGYDVTMEPLGDYTYRFAFSPLTITPEKMSEIFPKVGNWTLLPLPRYPATQVLRGGDILALDLFVNPATGQKIVDYLKIQGDQGRALTATGPARDFSVNEAIFVISSPEISINGKPAEKSRGTVTGTPVWIYLPSYGRFIFSLVPRADLGLQKAGEVRGSTMTWRWGNNDFALNADDRIAPGAGAYALYVWNNQRVDTRITDTAHFAMGTGGSLESLVRR